MRVNQHTARAIEYVVRRKVLDEPLLHNTQVEELAMVTPSVAWFAHMEPLLVRVYGGEERTCAVNSLLTIGAGRGVARIGVLRGARSGRLVILSSLSTPAGRLHNEFALCFLAFGHF